MWWYILGFVVIGLFTGSAMKYLWPGGIGAGYAVMFLLGLGGSLVGGLFTLLVFSYGRNYDFRYGVSPLTVVQADRIVGPSSWISVIASGVTAILFIALFGLVSHTQE